MGNYSVCFIEFPVRQGARESDFGEARTDRFVAAHRDGNRVVRACGITAPASEDKARIWHSGYADRRTVGVFRQVRVPRRGSTGASERIQSPLASGKVVGWDLLAWVLEEVVNLAIDEGI